MDNDLVCFTYLINFHMFISLFPWASKCLHQTHLRAWNTKWNFHVLWRTETRQRFSFPFVKLDVGLLKIANLWQTRTLNSWVKFYYNYYLHSPMCVMFYIVVEKEKSGFFRTWLSGNQKTLRLKPLSLKQTALPTYVSCVLRVFVIIYTKN